MRIQKFIDNYLKDTEFDSRLYRLTSGTFVMNQKGISIPPDGNTFKSKQISSYRVKQGILNNPVNDKRTTKGTFHIVKGGLPVPLDKNEVPKYTFAHMLAAALNPHEEMMELPFTANQEEKAKVMASLHLHLSKARRQVLER